MESLTAGSGKVSLGAASQTPELRTSCQHSEKYDISTNGEPVSQFPYPSRLGFLHSTVSGVSIRYVDLNKKLCRVCCDAVVPGGKYYAWSILAGTAAGDVSAVLAKLTPSDVFYPPIFQAGSESEAVFHPIPDIPGAKEVWQWLEAQGKPFYIDQLHLPMGRGITPLVRKRVAKDSAVALRYGQVVTLDLIRKSSELKPEKVLASKGKSEPRMNTKTASEKRSSKKTSAKASRKDSTGAGASKIDLLSEKNLENKSGAKSVIEQLEPITHDPKTVKPLSSKSSTKKSTARDPRPEATPAQKDKSTEEKLNSSSSVSLTFAAMTESQAITSVPSIPMTASAATKAFTRSWGWSEPFEFTTIRRKMPALSDYERVAEARVPNIPETKSLAHFVQKRLELEPAHKLRGPGDIDEATEAALGKLLSTQMKGSLSSSPKKSKTRPSITDDEELSAEKCSKALEANSSKSKSLGSDTKLSSSSKDTKLVKTHEKSGKASKQISSQLSKHQQSQTSSSRVTHLADGKVKTKQISTHEVKSAKSESKTSEVHARSIKTKETSQGPGSVAGLLRAGLNYAEHKISDAANKPADGKKHKRRKSSESKPRPHIKPDHGDPDHNGSESSAHSGGGKPPKPDQTEQSESGQPSTQTDPSIDGQPSSQMDAPAKSGPTAVTETPGQAEPSEQNPISVQGNTSDLANEPPQSIPQLSSGAGNFPGGYSNTSTHSPNLASMSAGEPSVQGGTAQDNDANGDQLMSSKPNWAEGYSSMDSVSQTFQSVQPAVEGYGSSDILHGSNPLPNDTGVSKSVEAAVRIGFNASPAETPGTSEHDHDTKGSGSVVAKDSGKGEASSYYDPKLAFTSNTDAGVNEPEHTRISDAEGKKIGGRAARQKHHQGKHKVNSHDGKHSLAKPSHGRSGKYNGRTSGTAAGLAGLAVGATVGYVAAEILKEGSSDSGSGSDSDSSSDSDNDTPSQDGNSDDSDSDSEDGVASESGEDGLYSDSDSGSDQDENAEVLGTDSESDADDNDIDNSTANEHSENEEQDDDHDTDHSTADELSEDDLSDAEQDDEDDDEGSEASQNEVFSDEEEGSDEHPTQQDSSGSEDDSSGNEESSVEGNDTTSDDEPSDIEENEQSNPEFSEPEDFDSE